jgi:hypothetical protein
MGPVSTFRGKGEKLSSYLDVVTVISLVDMPSHRLVLPRRPPAPAYITTDLHMVFQGLLEMKLHSLIFYLVVPRNNVSWFPSSNRPML